MQLRTEDEFSRAVTSDFSWRLKEISDLKTVVRRSETLFVPTVLRASIPIIYAHWEGHISHVSRAYMHFLAIRKPNYSSLKECFRINEFTAVLSKMEQNKFSQKQKIKFIQDVITSGNRQLRKVDENSISSKSNLNSDVLQDLCAVLSLDFSIFDDDTDFLDKILLARRNKIAHGENVSINLEAFTQISDRVITLMRKFYTLVENEVILARYKISI